jgi:hypothetical protein
MTCLICGRKKRCYDCMLYKWAEEEDRKLKKAKAKAKKNEKANH